MLRRRKSQTTSSKLRFMPLFFSLLDQQVVSIGANYENFEGGDKKDTKKRGSVGPDQCVFLDLENKEQNQGKDSPPSPTYKPKSKRFSSLSKRFSLRRVSFPRSSLQRHVKDKP